MDAADRSWAPDALPHLTNVPVAQLSPTLERHQEKCIEATVTLVWPYSSSTKSFGLLLAEPDFRLRRLHGQVKTIFHGRAAEKLTASHVGIGDNVRVALKGSSYVANETATQTPGRYVAWDVHFKSELLLEVKQSSKDSPTILIEEHSPSLHDREKSPPSTPRVASIGPESGTAAEHTSWESPAFLHPKKNQLGRLFPTSIETSTEEDGFVPGKGRKRPRYSLKRDDWHLVDEPMSPQDEGELGLDWWEKDSWEKLPGKYVNGEQDSEDVTNFERQNDTSNSEEDAVNHQDSGHASQDASSTFIKPSLEHTGGIFGRRPLQSNSANASTGPSPTSFQDRLVSGSYCPTDTPQLRPIPSPGLPIPSPIVSNSNNSDGYFSGAQIASQTLNADSVALEAEPSINVSGPMSSPNTSLVSPPPSFPVMSQYVASTHQNDGSIFASADVITHKSASPVSTNISSTEVGGNQQLSQPSPSGSSKNVQDAAIETAIDMEPVEEQRLSFAIDQNAAQPMGVDTLEPEMDHGEDYDVELREEAHSDSVSDVGIAPKDRSTDLNGPGILLDAHDILDAENQLKPSEARGPGSIKNDDASDKSQSQQYHNSRSEYSDEDVSANGSIFYDEDAFSPTNFEFQDDDDEIQYAETTEDESGEEDLPKQPPTQPEVIVLDSDSEDELISDHPVIPQPTQEGRDYQDLSLRSDDEEWDADEEEVDSQSAAEESGGESEALDLHDRVHESDKEDESSVDVLARDPNLEQPSSRESSVYDHNDEADVQGLETRAVSSRGHSDYAVQTSVNTESVIDLDSDEEQASQAGISTFPREDSAPASRIEKAWSDKIIYELDGTNDRGLDGLASPTRAEVQTVEKNPETRLMDFAGHQLLTPDPTQESVTNAQAPVINDVINVKDELPPNEDIQESSLGLNISPPSNMEMVSSVMYLSADHNMASSHLEQELISEGALERVPNETNADDPFIVVPTTEPVQTEEQLEVAREETTPKPPKVVISQLPTPDRHAHGLRSKLAYFAPLATLVDHYGALVDTLSIVHEASLVSKAAAGSKDYFMTIQLTDPSMAGTILQAQIFRRYKSAMPTLVGGNAVLLRNFKVHSYDHSIMLVSVESSSWAVFDGSGPQAQVNGPPVEYKSEERAYASGLRNWYSDIGSHMVADHQLQSSIQIDDMDNREGSAVLSESGSMESTSRDPTSSVRGSRRRKSYRRVTIHELRDGRRYTEVGSPSTKESIHELRDGTVYANL